MDSTQTKHSLLIKFRFFTLQNFKAAYASSMFQHKILNFEFLNHNTVCVCVENVGASWVISLLLGGFICWVQALDQVRDDTMGTLLDWR
jgi:hypothetical protein